MSPKTRGMVSVFAILAALALGPIVRAEDETLPVVRFHDGRFEPDELVVKAKTPFRLRVVNATQDAIEFESFELNRERVVLPGAEIVVYLPALDPGSYKFFDDFHHGAGEGTITAR
ncbi:MAG TPA: cupredoxin domain-containing protein [Myxococcota bacterium]|nr:cupredoxin domain-containing protein [Myxococcota bacterium]